MEVSRPHILTQNFQGKRKPTLVIGEAAIGVEVVIVPRQEDLVEVVVAIGVTVETVEVQCQNWMIRMREMLMVERTRSMFVPGEIAEIGTDAEIAEIEMTVIGETVESEMTSVVD